MFTRAGSSFHHQDFFRSHQVPALYFRDDWIGAAGDGLW